MIIDLFNANEYNFHSDLILGNVVRLGNAQLKIIKSASILFKISSTYFVF